MSGPRYTDWTHVRVTGDRGAAAPYVGQARKLLGYVMEDAARNGLGTHALKRTLPDGTVLVAEKHGDIPRVTIVPTAKASTGAKVELDDIVLWARDADRLDGIDATHPQQILRAAAKSNDRTYFYNEEVAGYDTFFGAKGTYGGVFPEGLTRAGNVDWTSKDDEVISWYGPTSRYWPDAFLQPRYMYGKWVFMLGRPVLDVEQYIADSPDQTHGSDHWVLGAALRSRGGARWLYTVQTEAPVLVTPTPDPGLAIYTPPHGAAAIGGAASNRDVTVYRYVLLESVDVAGVHRLNAAPGSREAMLTIPAMRQEPWVFNQSCTRAVCYAHPSAANGYFARVADRERRNLLEASGFLPPPPTQLLPPSEQRRYTLVINDDGAATSSSSALSVSNNAVPVPIATDFVDDEERSLYLRVAADFSLAVQIGDVLYPCTDVTIERDALYQWLRLDRKERWLVYADLRTNTLVTLRSHRQFENDDLHINTGAGSSVEVWRGSTQLVVFPPYAPGQVCNAFGDYIETRSSDDMYGALAGQDVAPHFYLHALIFSAVTGELGDSSDEALYPGFGYAMFPHPAMQYFGASGATTAHPDWGIAEMAYTDIGLNHPDLDGRHVAVGCATKGAALALSMYSPFNSQAGHDDEALHFLVGGTLPDATGVAGDKARFHPIWRLGKPPHGVTL